MAVFQVVVRSKGAEPRTFPVLQTPWTVGRGKSASLPLEGPGIWEKHLTFLSSTADGYSVEVAEGAFARVGGHDFRRHRLRNGDSIELGGISLSFQLAPVRRRSLGAWSAVLWLLLGVLALTQVTCLIWLAEG